MAWKTFVYEFNDCPDKMRIQIGSNVEVVARGQAVRIRAEGRVCQHCTEDPEDEVKHYDLRLVKE